MGRPKKLAQKSPRTVGLTRKGANTSEKGKTKTMCTNNTKQRTAAPTSAPSTKQTAASVSQGEEESVSMDDSVADPDVNLAKDKGDTVDSEHESDSHSKTNEVTEHVRPKKKGKTKKQYVRKTNTEYARSVVLEDEEWETATEYIEKHKILYDRGMAGYAKKTDVRADIYRDMAKHLNDTFHDGKEKWEKDDMDRFHKSQRTTLGKLKIKVAKRKRSGSAGGDLLDWMTELQRKLWDRWHFHKKYIKHRKGTQSKIDVELSQSDSADDESDSDRTPMDLTTGRTASEPPLLEMPDIPEHPRDTPLLRQDSIASSTSSSRKRKNRTDDWLQSRREDREIFQQSHREFMAVMSNQKREGTTESDAKYPDVEACVAQLRVLFNSIKESHIRSKYTKQLTGIVLEKHESAVIEVQEFEANRQMVEGQKQEEDNREKQQLQEDNKQLRDRLRNLESQGSDPNLQYQLLATERYKRAQLEEQLKKLQDKMTQPPAQLGNFRLTDSHDTDMQYSTIDMQQINDIGTVVSMLPISTTATTPPQCTIVPQSNIQVTSEEIMTHEDLLSHGVIVSTMTTASAAANFNISISAKEELEKYLSHQGQGDGQ